MWNISSRIIASVVSGFHRMSSRNKCVWWNVIVLWSLWLLAYRWRRRYTIPAVLNRYPIWIGTYRQCKPELAIYRYVCSQKASWGMDVLFKANNGNALLFIQSHQNAKMLPVIMLRHKSTIFDISMSITHQYFHGSTLKSVDWLIVFALLLHGTIPYNYTKNYETETNKYIWPRHLLIRTSWIIIFCETGFIYIFGSAISCLWNGMDLG